MDGYSNSGQKSQHEGGLGSLHQVYFRARPSHQALAHFHHPSICVGVLRPRCTCPRSLEHLFHQPSFSSSPPSRASPGLIGPPETQVFLSHFSSMYPSPAPPSFAPFPHPRAFFLFFLAVSWSSSSAVISFEQRSRVRGGRERGRRMWGGIAPPPIHRRG